MRPYVFAVAINGSKATCKATLGAPATARSCDQDPVSLTTDVSPNGRQRAITGLFIRSTAVKSVTIRATRDGSVLIDSTRVPAYAISPGPNGPDCDPRGCALAAYTLP